MKIFEEFRTMTHFLENPSQEFGVRETARLVKVSPATASTRLKEFSEMNILKRRKDRVYDLYSADLESESYRDFKTYYNIVRIRKSGLIGALNMFYLRPAIVLFGSASDGMDDCESDIDMLILSENTSDFPEAEKFEKKLERPLHLFAFKDVKEAKNEHLINNMINGIVLQGKPRWI